MGGIGFDRQSVAAPPSCEPLSVALWGRWQAGVQLPRGYRVGPPGPWCPVVGQAGVCDQQRGDA